MKRLNKRQLKRIEHMFREKRDRKEKQQMLHSGELPKYIERHVPLIRRLAPNLDQLMIVASFAKPKLKVGLIDRLTVLAEIEELETIICLNKVDLLEERAVATDLAAIYRDIGYEVVITSAKEKSGLEELFDLMGGKTTALAGHSGVGKSSLLNALDPELEIRVGEVSEWNQKGRHTTTTVTNYRLSGGIDVIDLPGMKHVDFPDLHRDELRLFFREFNERAEGCKFNDCLHIHEDACAIKAAITEGEISEERYNSYMTIFNTL